MILPYPRTLDLVKKHPLTLSLVIINVLIFFVIFFKNEDNLIYKNFFTKTNLMITGRLYSQFLHENNSTKDKPDWLFKMDMQDEDQLDVLSFLALKDREFVLHADKISFRGDIVEISLWKENFLKFKKSYFSNPVYWFGLSSIERPLTAWITYQFSHSGFWHLLSNIIFLLLIAAAVEELAGGIALIVIYLIGGISGGWAFLLLNQHNITPMVGASAAISALLAFYAIIEPRQRIRYLFFIAPVTGQNGIIYLPTLLIIPLYLVVDFAHLLSTPEGMGSGIAYSAHIGGTLSGLAIALLFRMWDKPLRFSK